MVSRFVNPAVPADARRSLRITIVCVIAATIVCVMAGAFHTAELPLPTRSLFWLVLISFSAIKWWSWGQFVSPNQPHGSAGNLLYLLGGAILLNATLPLEINWLYSAFGLDSRLPWLSIFLSAAAMSLVIGLVIMVVAAPATGMTPAPPPPPAVPTGLAARHDPAGIHAIVAEDHYLRLHLADGSKPLVLYRFGDAVRELAGIDGLQVHRGSWVAAAAVTGAIRDGRKWRLQIAGGIEIAVSETYLAAVRARGWLVRAR